MKKFLLGAIGFWPSCAFAMEGLASWRDLVPYGQSGILTPVAGAPTNLGMHAFGQALIVGALVALVVAFGFYLLRDLLSGFGASLRRFFNP